MMFLFKAKFICLVLLLALLTPVSKAQVNIAAFLSSAIQDPELEVYSNQINFLNQGLYRLAPVRGIELRTQNNQWGSGEQQYGFRISPANPWEVKYTNRVFRSRQMALSLQKELLLKELLAKRYQLVNDLIFLNEMRTLKEALMQNTDNQIKALDNLKASSFFDAEDFVELKLEQMEDQTDMESFNFEIDQKVKVVEGLYAAAGALNPDWTYAAVISLPRLERLVDSLMTSAPLFATKLAYRQERIKLADYEHALQKVNINPGFIQTEYMPYRFSENKSPMGISLGVNIPLFNPNKGDMAEKRLDILEAKSQLNLEKQQAEEKVKKLSGALKNNLERYQKLEQRLKSYRVTETFATVNALTKNNPLITLKFNAQVLKLQKIQLQLKSEIYQTYLELLTETEILNQKPLINFLSNRLQPL